MSFIIHAGLPGRPGNRGRAAPGRGASPPGPAGGRLPASPRHWTDSKPFLPPVAPPRPQGWLCVSRSPRVHIPREGPPRCCAGRSGLVLGSSLHPREVQPSGPRMGAGAEPACGQVALGTEGAEWTSRCRRAVLPDSRLRGTRLGVLLPPRGSAQRRPVAWSARPVQEQLPGEQRAASLPRTREAWPCGRPALRSHRRPRPLAPRPSACPQLSPGSGGSEAANRAASVEAAPRAAELGSCRGREHADRVPRGRVARQEAALPGPSPRRGGSREASAWSGARGAPVWSTLILRDGPARKAAAVKVDFHGGRAGGQEGTELGLETLGQGHGAHPDPHRQRPRPQPHPGREGTGRA